MALGLRRSRRPLAPGEWASELDKNQAPYIEEPISETSKAYRQGLRNTAAGAIATRGAFNVLTGDEDEGVEQLARAHALQERASAEGPGVRELANITGVGSALQYGANQLAMQVPNLATALVPGGLGAKVGKNLAVKAAQREAAKRIAASPRLQKRVMDAVGRTRTMPADRAAADAMMREGRKAVAGELVGRTRAGVSGAIVGGAVGGAVGGTQMELGQLAPAMALDPEGEGSTRERVGKALVGATAAGSLEAVPTLMLLKKTGLLGAARGEVTRTARQALGKVAKGAASQAAAEGGTEFAQTVIERAAQKWVNKNIGMLTPDAFAEYLNATVAGATVGSVLGGATSVRLPTGARDKAGTVAGKVKSAFTPSGPKSGERMTPEKPKASRSAFEIFSDYAENLPDEGIDPLEYADLETVSPEEISEDSNSTDDVLERLMGEIAGDADENIELRTVNVRDEGSKEIRQDSRPFAPGEGEQSDLDRAQAFRGRVLRKFAGAQAPDELITGLRKLFEGSPFDKEGKRREATKLADLISFNRSEQGEKGSLSKDEMRAVHALSKRLEQDPDQDSVMSSLQLMNNYFYDLRRRATERARLDTEERAAARKPLVDVALRRTYGDASVDTYLPVKNFRDTAYASLIKSARTMGIPGAKEAAEKGRTQGTAIGPDELSPEVRKFIESKLPAFEKKFKRPITIADLNKIAQKDVGPPAGFVRGYRKDKDGRQTPVFVNLHDAVGQAARKIEGARGEKMQDALAEAVASLAEQGIFINKDALKPDTAVRYDNQGKVFRVKDFVSKGGNKKKASAPHTDPREIQDRVADPDDTNPNAENDVREGAAVFDVARGELPPSAGAANVATLKARLTGLQSDATVKAAVTDAKQQLLEEKQAKEEENKNRILKGMKQWPAKGDKAGWRKVFRQAREPEPTLTEIRMRAAKLLTERAQRRTKDGKPAEPVSQRALDFVTISQELDSREGATAPENDTAMRSAADLQAAAARQQKAKDRHANRELQAKNSPPRILGNMRGFTPTDAPSNQSKPVKEPAAPTDKFRFGGHEKSKQHISVIERLRAAKNQRKPSLLQLSRLARSLLDYLGVKADIRLTFNLQEYDRLADTFTLDVPLGQMAKRKDGNGYVVFIDDEGYSSPEMLTTLMHELGHVVFQTEFENASFEVRAAIRAEFATWRAKAKKSETLAELNKERSSVIEVLASQGNPLKLADMDSTEVEYYLDFEEWVVEQIVRSLQQNTEAQGIVTKFFRAVAAKLRELYAMLTEAEAKPATSVEAFVQGLIRATPAARARATAAAAVVQQGAAAGAPTPAHTAAAAHAAAPFSPATNQTIRYGFQRLSRAHKALLRRVLGREAIAAQLRNLLAGTPDAALIDDPIFGMEARVAFAFQFWQAGQLQLNAFDDPFSALLSDFAGILHVASDNDYVQQLFTDLGNNATGNRAYSVFEKVNINANALSKIAGRYRHVMDEKFMPMLDKFFTSGMDEMLREMEIPAFKKLALIFKPKSGDRVNDLGIFQARVVKAGHFHKQMGNIVNGLTEEQVDQLGTAHRTKNRAALTPELQQRYDALNAMFDELYGYVTNHGGIKLGKRENYSPIVMLEPQELEAKRTEFMALFAQPRHEAAMRRKLYRVYTRALRNQTGGISPRHRAHATRIGNYVQGLSLDQLANQFFEMAKGPEYDSSPDWIGGMKPAFREMNEQLMDFMSNSSEQADRDAFAQLQEPNFARVLARYIEHAAKRAEFNHRLPKDTLAQLFVEATAQGATQEQLKLAHDYIDVMQGSYGLGLNPSLHWMFKKIDSITGTDLANKPELIRKWNGYLVVYQNIRNLPLALLSSLVDPLGVGIRTGAMFDAFDAMRDTIKTAFKSGDMADWREAAENWGIVETAVTNEALAMAYGGLHLTPGARALSDTFFKWIGLSEWTRASRVAAYAMGHRFLARHADGTYNKHSERYLKELGLRPGQVQVDSRGMVNMSDPAVRNAVLRFVDEAILRPDPSQRPLWMSDPNWQLVSQYKPFLYAFRDTVLRRIGNEVANGNYQVIMIALAYVPLMLMSELLRELLQHGPEGDPRRAAWGPSEYMTHAYTRTGLLGTSELAVQAVQDVNYGHLPGASMLGPTLSQTRDAFFSEKPTGRVIIEALPGAALHEDHWRVGNESARKDQDAPANDRRSERVRPD